MTDKKSIVITGASTGIGAATAKLFAAEGCQVYNLDYRAPDHSDPAIHFIQCDVSNFSQLSSAFAQVMTKEKELNYLFSNAGVFLSATLEDTSLEDIDRVININLKGQMYALKCALPIMKKQQSGGKIVLMGSDTCFLAKPGMSLYGATKGGIAMLTKNVAVDYAKYNIAVNCVCPGPIVTPIFQRWVSETVAQTGKTAEEVTKTFAQSLPAGKIGTPESVAQVVKFLCSDSADFMIGSLVSIDGGSTAL